MIMTATRVAQCIRTVWSFASIASLVERTLAPGAPPAFDRGRWTETESMTRTARPTQRSRAIGPLYSAAGLFEGARAKGAPPALYRGRLSIAFRMSNAALHTQRVRAVGPFAPSYRVFEGAVAPPAAPTFGRGRTAQAFRMAIAARAAQRAWAVGTFTAVAQLDRTFAPRALPAIDRRRAIHLVPSVRHLAGVSNLGRRRPLTRSTGLDLNPPRQELGCATICE